MSYRSSLSRSLHGSLEGSDSHHQSNLDRLTAFSFAGKANNSLGTLLYRLKYDLDSSVHADAISALRQAAGVSLEAASVAISEWLDPNCKRCGGKAQMKVAEKLILCPACTDHPGKHRFSDQSRASFLRVSLGTAKRMSGAIRRAHETIGSADRHVSGTMSAQLKD